MTYPNDETTPNSGCSRRTVLTGIVGLSIGIATGVKYDEEIRGMVDDLLDYSPMESVRNEVSEQGFQNIENPGLEEGEGEKEILKRLVSTVNNSIEPNSETTRDFYRAMGLENQHDLEFFQPTLVAIAPNTLIYQLELANPQYSNYVGKKAHLIINLFDRSNSDYDEGYSVTIFNTEASYDDPNLNLADIGKRLFVAQKTFDPSLDQLLIGYSNANGQKQYAQIKGLQYADLDPINPNPNYNYLKWPYNKRAYREILKNEEGFVSVQLIDEERSEEMASAIDEIDIYSSLGSYFSAVNLYYNSNPIERAWQRVRR